MDTLGLTGRLSKIKGFDKMQAWRNIVEEYMEDEHMEDVLENPASISLPRSDSELGSHDQDGEDEDDTCRTDNCRTVTTTLRQIVRDELNLVDVEQQLTLEQKSNHQVFAALYRIIQEVVEMVRFCGHDATRLHYYCTDFHQLSGYFGKNLLNCQWSGQRTL